jgi:hypothetical protein
MTVTDTVKPASSCPLTLDPSPPKRGRGEQVGPRTQSGRRGAVRWGAWCGVLLLAAAGLVFCHGCHGDEDNELSVAGWKARREPGKTTGWEEGGRRMGTRTNAD